MISVVINLVKWGGLDYVLTQGHTLPEQLKCTRLRIGGFILIVVLGDNFCCLCLDGIGKINPW
jgi:hypothetical protein